MRLHIVDGIVYTKMGDQSSTARSFFKMSSLQATSRATC